MDTLFSCRMLPAAKYSLERRETLKTYISSLSMAELQDVVRTTGIEDINKLVDIVDQYWTLADNAHIGKLTYSADRPMYLIAGGRSCKNCPTDACELMQKLESMPIYRLLKKWAEVDLNLKNEIRKTSDYEIHIQPVAYINIKNKVTFDSISELLTGWANGDGQLTISFIALKEQLQDLKSDVDFDYEFDDQAGDAMTVIIDAVESLDNSNVGDVCFCI